ncbi:MAG: hypothetical protein ACREOI_08265 [bacterium]
MNMKRKTSRTKPATARPYPEASKIKTGSANRVAESVAAYSVARPRSTYKRRPSLPRRIAGHVVTDEVWQFAIVNDLIPHLKTATRLVHECFPTVRKVEFLYVIDSEVENWSWITIAIKVSGTVEEVLAQMNRFDNEMIRQVPIEKGEKICLRVGGL